MTQEKILRKYAQYITKLETNDIVGVSGEHGLSLSKIVKDIQRRSNETDLVICPIAHNFWALTYRGKKPRKLSNEGVRHDYFDF